MPKHAERPLASPVLSHSDLQPGAVHASKNCWANGAHKVDKGLVKQISEVSAFGNSMNFKTLKLIQNISPEQLSLQRLKPPGARERLFEG